MSTSTYMTAHDVAEMLVVPVRTLERWRYVGAGPPFHRIGRGVRYKQSDVEAWISTQRVDPTKKEA